MKVIVTGATGMVGKGVLLECLDHKDIQQVLSIGRKPLGIDHPKLQELIHKDFSEFASVTDSLKGYDACYHCMGVSAASFSKEEYFTMTHGYSMALAESFLAVNPGSTFTYVSGQGTYTSEKRSGWASVKGKTENDLLKMDFKQAFMFRPGGIIPLRGIEPSSKLYRRAIKYMGWLLQVMKKLAPNSIVTTTQIGLAMIHATQNGYTKQVIDPIDIIQLAGE